MWSLDMSFSVMRSVKAVLAFTSWLPGALTDRPVSTLKNRSLVTSKSTLSMLPSTSRSCSVGVASLGDCGFGRYDAPTPLEDEQVMAVVVGCGGPATGTVRSHSDTRSGLIGQVVNGDAAG